jgi:hypothetical protein
MDSFHSAHPTAETLRGYSLGELDDASADAVARHLEQCPECERLVAEMAPDTFLNGLRRAQAAPETPAANAEIPGESQTDQGGSDPDKANVRASKIGPERELFLSESGALACFPQFLAHHGGPDTHGARRDRFDLARPR